MCWNDSKKTHKTERNISNTRTVCMPWAYSHT